MKDGIAEILASGRAPGVIVRGNGIKIDHENRLPVMKGLADNRCAEELERDYQKVVDLKARAHAETRKERGHFRKPRDGEIRHIGSTPLHKYIAARKQLGDDAFKGDNTQKTIREMGDVFKGE